jgi:hypothetical protein
LCAKIAPRRENQVESEGGICYRSGDSYTCDCASGYWCSDGCDYPQDYDKDESITIQRRTKGALDKYAQWQISFGNTRFYSTDDSSDARGNDNTPPVYSGDGAHLGYNYLSSVDRTLKKAEIHDGHCEIHDGRPLGCTPEPVVPNLPYDVPVNPCPRFYCVRSAALSCFRRVR